MNESGNESERKKDVIEMREDEDGDGGSSRRNDHGY